MKSLFICILLFSLPIFLNAQIWENVNPAIHPKEVNSVAIQEDGYGILSGGKGFLFQTHDFGENWDYLRKGIFLNKICVLSNGDFVGVNIKGNFSRSKDKGQNWSTNFIGESQKSFSEIDMNFIDENMGFIVDHGDFGFSYIYTTSNGGLNWEESEKFQDVGFEKIVIKSRKEIFVTTEKPGITFKSIDGGKSWGIITIDSTKVIEDIYFLDRYIGFAYSWESTYKSAKYKTVDGGNSWELLEDDMPKLINTSFISINKGIGLAYWGELYKTKNAGETWELFETSALGYSKEVHYLNEETIIVVGNALYFSKDAGETWKSFDTTITKDILGSIAFMSDTEVYVGGFHGTLLKSIDGGSTFENLEIGHKIVVHDILCFEENKIILAGGKGKLIRSNDNGVTWYSESVPLERSTSIEMIGNNIWILGGLNKILKSNDSGISWELIEFELTQGTSQSISFINESNGFILYNDRNLKTFMLRTLDGGLTWKEWDINGNSIFDFSFISASEGFALGENLYKTEDAGISWNEISQMDQSWHTFSMCFINKNTGFMVGTQGRIQKTIDGGVTWKDENTYTIESDIFTNISFSSGGNGLALGNDGLILRNSD